jgi:hypothetical protein
MTSEQWRSFVAVEENEERILEKSKTRWRIRVNHKELHPMRYDELINFLKTQAKISAIELSNNDENPDWKEVYAFNEIKDDLDISRRTHTRVPIMGTLTCYTDEGPSDMRMISISEAGIGANCERQMQVGEKFSATIKSQNLRIAINCKCEVLYLGAKGFVGLGFSSLPPDFKMALEDYINKFTGN